MALLDKNKNATRYWVIIPAAGVGQRMGVARPAKQYMSIADTTVIQASISCFLRHAKISAIVVALHAQDQSWSRLKIPTDKPIYTVTGGETRASSVQLALQRVMQEAKDDDFVLVHDAARPCLQSSDLNRLMQELAEDEVGGILAMPISDTIKQAKTNLTENKQINSGNAEITTTIDRSSLWKAFTPQMFRVAKLNKALKYCFENNIQITDEASALEALGLAVKLVQGREDNIKITSCLLYTSPSPRDQRGSRMPSSA